MNEKQFFDLIRNIYTALKCPSCGEVYRVEEIQLLGHFDGFFLMQMTCSKCKLPVSVNFYTAKDPKDRIGDLKLKDLKSIQKEIISTNEVIDFHKALKSFDGDIAKAIRGRKKRK